MHNTLNRDKLFHLFIQKYIAHFIFFLLCVLILVPLLISSYRNTRQEILNDYSATLNQELESLDAEIDSVIKTSYILKKDTYYRHLLSVTGKPDVPQIYLHMLELQDTLSNLCLSHERYRDVYILFQDNPIYISNYLVADDYRDIYPVFLKGQEDTADEWHDLHFSNSVPFEISADSRFFSSYNSPREYYALTFVVNLSPYTVFAKQGVLVCNLDFMEIVKNIIPSVLLDTAFLYITDSNANIIASYNYSVQYSPDENATALDTDNFSLLTSRRSDSGYQITLGVPNDSLSLASYSPLLILKSYLQVGMLLILLFSIFLAFRETITMRKVVHTASVLFPSSGSFTKGTNEYTYISNILTNNAADLSSLNSQVKSFALENLFLSDKNNDAAQMQKFFQESFDAYYVIVIKLNNYICKDNHVPVPLEEDCRTLLNSPFISAYTNISELSLLILQKDKESPEPSRIENNMKELLNQIQQQAGPDTVIHIGISSVYSGPEHIREAYLQVQTTLNLLSNADLSEVFVYSEPQSLIYQKTLDVSLLMKCYDSLLCGDQQSILFFFEHINDIVQNGDYDQQESLQLLFSIRQPIFNAYQEICAANELNKLVTELNPPAINLRYPIKKNISILQDFAFQLCDQIQTRKSAKRSQLMDNIFEFIRTNCFDPNFSVFTVTNEFPISKNYILQLTKETTGKSFKAYVESIRIDKAEFLLKNTEKTNIQIAAECGFCSENTFYRAFARRHGTTPVKWVEGLFSNKH